MIKIENDEYEILLRNVLNYFKDIFLYILILKIFFEDIFVFLDILENFCILDSIFREG